MDYPDTAGLRVSRREFVPDGRRAALIELSLRSTGGDRHVEAWVDAHSELMSSYPWGETRPSQLDFNGQDAASFDAGELTFTEAGKPWTAMVSSSPPASGGETGPGFRGPHANPIVCGPSGPGQPAPPPRCQDTAYGKGAGGRLSYEMKVPAGRERRLLIAVAGSDRGGAEARRELRKSLDGADDSFRAKLESRRKLERYSQLSLPGDPLLAQGIDWSKQNLADSVQVAEGLQVRELREGRQYPRPSGSVQHVRFVGAGWPDYPWLFATDGEYTAFAAVAVGQFEPTMDHLRALRDVSRVANGDTGKVVHEVMTDGSIYFGANEDPGKPAARRAARHGTRPPRGRAAGAGRPRQRRRLEHPTRPRRLRRRQGARLRLALCDRRPRPRPAAPARHRPHAAARGQRAGRAPRR